MSATEQLALDLRTDAERDLVDRLTAFRKHMDQDWCNPGRDARIRYGDGSVNTGTRCLRCGKPIMSFDRITSHDVRRLAWVPSEHPLAARSEAVYCARVPQVPGVASRVDEFSAILGRCRNLQFSPGLPHPGWVGSICRQPTAVGCTAIGTLHPGWLALSAAAVVLERPVRDVRNMVRRGELADARPGRRRGIATGQLSALVTDRPLALAVLEAIAEGRLHVPALRLDEVPPSLMESWAAIR